MSVWETVEIYDPPAPANTLQPGVTTSLLYSGSKFTGHQKSKGNSYDVVVNLQVPPSAVIIIIIVIIVVINFLTCPKYM